MGYILLLAGLWCAVLALKMFIRILRTTENEQMYAAEIIDIKKDKVLFMNSQNLLTDAFVYTPVLKFMDKDGREIIAVSELNFIPRKYKIGDKVQIIHNREIPCCVKIINKKCRKVNFNSLLVTAAIALICLGTVLILTK